MYLSCNINTLENTIIAVLMFYLSFMMHRTHFLNTMTIVRDE